MPAIHPAALMFPTADRPGVDELYESIQRHGLQEPVVLTPEGKLLEGRGRWKACRRLELVPRHRVEETDPWLYIIKSNWAILEPLDAQARAIMIGAIPSWSGTSRPRNATRYEDPPSLTQIGEVAQVPRQAVTRGQKLHRTAVASLRKLVFTGACPLYTAVRVADEMSPEDQEVFVNRVLNGANPLLTAPGESEDRRRARHVSPGEGTIIRGRARFVRPNTVRQLIDTLNGVGIVVDAADGLDPGITPQEAAALSKELAANHLAYSRLAALLKARKEQT